MTIRLTTEAGELLKQEGLTDYLLQEGLSASLVGDASVVGAMADILDLGTATGIAVSSLTASLSTEINLLASIIDVSTQASAYLTTAIRMRASCLAEASLSGAVGDSYVYLSASLTAQATATASITTAIRLNATFSAVPDLSNNFSSEIRMAAELLASASVISAGLYVYRIEPVYASRTQKIYLAEIEAYNPATASTVTHRFSTGGGYNNAGTWYAPRIENPATFRREMGGNQLGTRTSSSYGELTLVNADGGLNDLSSQFFDGRSLTLKIGAPTDSYASFTTILKATIETVSLERERVSVRLRDRSSILDTPFCTVKYAGTNALPNGIEGTPDNIQGQTKPRIFGRIALMSPVLVNTSKLIYQINNGSIDSIVNVFDAGAYLTRSTDYSSQSDMENNAPAAGTYRSWPAGGCFRLGASPFGQLSVCAVEKWDYTYCTAANIVQRILTEKGLTSSDWVAADFTALNQKNAGSLGVIVGPDETTASLIDRICESIGAWWGFDSLNRFRIARFDGPSSTPEAVITHDELLELERSSDAVFPLWQVTVKADQNYVVQDKTAMAGVVPDFRANWFEQEFRDQKTEDTSVKTLRLLSTVDDQTSLLNGISQAKAESARKLALFSPRRDTVNMTVVDPAGTFSSLDLGDTVLIQTEFLGYDAGRTMVIVGMQPDYERNQLDLKVWG